MIYQLEFEIKEIDNTNYQIRRFNAVTTIRQFLLELPNVHLLFYSDFL